MEPTDSAEAGPVLSDWSALPYDIIHTVSTYLLTIEDFFAFSAVCRSWRSVYLAKQWHCGPQVPWLMLSNFENSSIRSFENFGTSKVYKSEIPETFNKRCWGSSSGWLLTIGNDLKIDLLNPFTRVSKSLPPKSSLQIHFGEILAWYDIIVKAFVFNTKPCTLDAIEEDLFVVIIYGPLKQLAVCRPGFSSWKSVSYLSSNGFKDVAFVKDQLFALSDLGALVKIDPNSLAARDVIGPRHFFDAVVLFPRWDWDQLFLVESSGELWIVCQNRYRAIGTCVESIEFSVYSFSFTTKKWIRLHDLGDQAIFIGDNCCMSICATDHVSCTSNTIYFIRKDMEQDWPYREFHVDLGSYSMATGITGPLPLGPTVPKIYSFPMWVMPTLK